MVVQTRQIVLSGRVGTAAMDPRQHFLTGRQAVGFARPVVSVGKTARPTASRHVLDVGGQERDTWGKEVRARSGTRR